MLAVAMVVLNRLKSPEFPATICEVVHEGAEKGCQFSYWCDGKGDTPERNAAWRLAEKIAREVLAHPPKHDPTKGALYYHAVGEKPLWDPPGERTVRIGSQVYYR